MELDDGTVAEEEIFYQLGRERTIERYHCSHGAINPAYLDVLREHGLQFTGHDDAGDVHIADLSGHPFFLATTLFQPELADATGQPHSIISAFATAAAEHAAARARAGVGPSGYSQM